MTINSKLEFLSKRTQKGIFLTTTGTHFWVFESYKGLVALQIKRTSTRPAFSFHQLDAIPVAAGKWLGPAVLATSNFDAPPSRGVAGVLCRYRDRVLVKACASTGTSERLVVYDYLYQRYVLSSEYCEFWQLKVPGAYLTEAYIPLLKPTPLAPYHFRRRGVFSEPLRMPVR